jgi:hypothetical protein
MADYTFDYFNVTFPKQYVAQVEINRPDKLNAFIEVCVQPSLFITYSASHIQPCRSSTNKKVKYVAESGAHLQEAVL